MRLNKESKCSRTGKGSVVIENVKNSKGCYNSQASHVHHSYPVKFLIPKYASETNCCWIYPITYGGGLVESDQIDINVKLKPNCTAVLTSQESTKVFECNNSLTTSQICNYTIDKESMLCVLGDPIVCFASAIFSQKQIIEMSADGNLVLLDWLSAGRIARQEKWNFTSYKNTIQVYVENELVINEVNHLENTPTLTLQQAMMDFEVSGCFIILGKDTEDLTQFLLQKYDAKQNFGENLSETMVCSISTLQFTVENKIIKGCYLRFLSSMSKAYSIINDVTSKLLPVIGSDPFYNKY